MGRARAIVVNAVICKMIWESQECSSMWNLDQQYIALRKIEDRLETVASHCCSYQFGRQAICLTAHLNCKAFKSYNKYDLIYVTYFDMFLISSLYLSAFLCLSHIKSKGRSKKMEKRQGDFHLGGGGALRGGEVPSAKKLLFWPKKVFWVSLL